jgi:alkylation response protein AidB-like acyl-CoA dehydrogenase
MPDAAGAATLADEDSELDELLADLASVVRAAVADQPGDRPPTVAPAGPDRARWRRYAELGWLSLLVDAERGGAGADERAAAVVARGLGVACRREPFVAAGVMVPRCLTGLGDSAAVRALLDEVTAGDTLAVLAWQSERGECGPAVAAEDLPVEARRDGDGLVLTGSVSWVPTSAADVYLVAARSEGEVVLVRVDRGTEGLAVAPQRAADGTSWARLDLNDVRVVAGAVLGSGPEARDALSSAVDAGVLVCAAELLGLVDRMIELTLGYLSSRRQFGRPIGSFQALQHRAVDMWVQQRLTSAALHSALRRACAHGAGPGTLALAASSAKARASSAALRVGNESVQLHGAIGFTDEYALGGYVNRALVLAAWLGNANAHTRRHGRLATAAPPATATTDTATTDTATTDTATTEPTAVSPVQHARAAS